MTAGSEWKGKASPPRPCFSEVAEHCHDGEDRGDGAGGPGQHCCLTPSPAILLGGGRVLPWWWRWREQSTAGLTSPLRPAPHRPTPAIMAMLYHLWGTRPGVWGWGQQHWRWHWCGVVAEGDGGDGGATSPPPLCSWEDSVGWWLVALWPRLPLPPIILDRQFTSFIKIIVQGMAETIVQSDFLPFQTLPRPFSTSSF